jgi:uncharacterized protein (DUF952 family)
MTNAGRRIYHIASRKTWEEALSKGFYEAPSLATEGFIHCSEAHQIAGVLERYYKDAGDLLKLSIDPALLTSPLKYELSPSINEAFPHVYGPIDLVAVIEISKIP